MQNVSRREGLYVLSQSLLTLLLFIGGSYVPFLGFWGTLFCPLPLALVGCRLGWRWMVGGLGLTTFLMGLLYPVSALLYYVLARMPISLALFAASVLTSTLTSTGTASPTRTSGEGLLICAISALAAEVALWLVFYLMTGQNILLPDISQVEAMILQMQGGLDPSQADTIKLLVQQIHTFVPYVLPSMVTLYAGADAVLNYKLGSRLLSAKTKVAPVRSLIPLPPFTNWRLPRSLLPALCFAFILGVFANWQKWLDVAMFSMNLKIVLNVLFFIQGLSLAHWWMVQHKFGLLLRGVLFALMLLPLAWLWVVMLGVLDMVLDLRNKKRRTSN